MSEIQREFKGIWIPKEIWLAEELTTTEKVLLCEIHSLCGDEGCFASNGYFAKFFKVTEQQISNCISNLKKLGYLYQANFDGRRRVIKTNLDPQPTYKQPISPVIGSLVPNLYAPTTYNINDNKDYNNSSLTSQTASAPVKTPSIFNGKSSTPKSKTDKALKWFNEQIDVLALYSFDSLVESKLIEFFEMLRQSNTLHPKLTIEAQLNKLAKVPANKQSDIITTTITRGWKSLDYSIENYLKENKPKFDTSNGAGQEKRDWTEAEKRQEAF